jgi:hypothetical protein
MFIFHIAKASYLNLRNFLPLFSMLTSSRNTTRTAAILPGSFGDGRRVPREIRAKSPGARGLQYVDFEIFLFPWSSLLGCIALGHRQCIISYSTLF